MEKIIIFMVVGLLGLMGIAIFGQSRKKRNSWKAQSFNLVLTAMFIAISIVLTQFRIYIPLFGFPSVRFSLTEIPIFLTGSLLGGIYGAMAGFVTDIISFIIAPQGPYHFGFTLNLMLVGLLPGIIFKVIRETKFEKSFGKFNKALCIVALVGALIYINGIGLKELEAIGTIGSIPVNIVLSLLFMVLVGVLGFVVHKLKQNYEGNEGYFSIDQIIFVISINYIVVNLLLTPIWLLHLYNLPITTSLLVRIFKSLIEVPLQVIVVYTIVHTIPLKMRARLS